MKRIKILASQPVTAEIVRIHTEPKKGPPRRDLRKLRVLDEPDLAMEDPDLDNDPDLSLAET